jgi:hypothetical protein
VKHYSDDELTLYYYGEARRPADVERHLGECPSCQAMYRAIAGTLAMIVEPPVPERGDLYGLEVWQRIRHQLPAQEASWRSGWFTWNRLAIAGSAAAVLVAVTIAFVAGRMWRPAVAPQPTATSAAAQAAAGDARQRVLLASVAEHLDRSDRVLTDIMNAPAGVDISAEQRWAGDLLSASRLYRQDAMEAGEQSVASVLDEIERSLVEIVHSPAKASAADLEQLRRRIDAAALLFKIRVLHDELRGREAAPALPRKTT